MSISLPNTEKLAKSWTAYEILKEAILKDVSLILSERTANAALLELELAQTKVENDRLINKIKSLGKHE